MEIRLCDNSGVCRAFVRVRLMIFPLKFTHFLTVPIPCILNVPLAVAVVPFFSLSGTYVEKSLTLTKQWSLAEESAYVAMWCAWGQVRYVMNM